MRFIWRRLSLGNQRLGWRRNGKSRHDLIKANIIRRWLSLRTWLTVQWEKWTGGRRFFFLRAATDDNISWLSLMSNIVNKVLNLKNFGSTFLSFLPLYMSHQGRGWYGNHQIDIMLDASETNLCVQRNNVAKFKVCVTRIFLDAKVLQKSCRGALNGAEW